MNQDRFEGNLKQFRGKLNERWGWLISDAKREFEGQREQRSGRIQAQYGNSKEAAARQLKEFHNRHREL